MTMRRHPASVTGTFANRLVHWDSQQAIIGPQVIDANGNVRTIDDLKGQRLAATMRHLDHPTEVVYFLTMAGLLFEVDLNPLKAKKLVDHIKELENPPGQAPHFNSGFSAHLVRITVDQDCNATAYFMYS